MAFDRMVLFGSVVNGNYPWPAVITRGGVRAVRNETGSEDYVVKLAKLAFWIRDMGDSGVGGFANATREVENVPFSFDHNDAVVLRNHILETWLPFLWGIPPQEYQFLLRQAADCLDALPRASIGSLEGFADFDSSAWSWTWKGQPERVLEFRTFLEEHLALFCVGHRASWLVGTPRFADAYVLARYLFWQLCQDRDDHPRLMAVRAAEQAANTLCR